MGERGTALCECHRRHRSGLMHCKMLKPWGLFGDAGLHGFPLRLHSANPYILLPPGLREKGIVPLSCTLFPVPTVLPVPSVMEQEELCKRRGLFPSWLLAWVQGKDVQLVCRSPQDILPIEVGVCMSAVPPGYICCRAALLGIPLHPAPPQAVEAQRRGHSRLFLPAAMSAPAQARAASW